MPEAQSLYHRGRVYQCYHGDMPEGRPGAPEVEGTSLTWFTSASESHQSTVGPANQRSETAFQSWPPQMLFDGAQPGGVGQIGEDVSVESFFVSPALTLLGTDRRPGVHDARERGYPEGPRPAPWCGKDVLRGKTIKFTERRCAQDFS